MDNAIPQRLQSLDVFRGLTIAVMIIVNTPGDWDHVYAPLRHSEWNGCTPTDVVFPCFIFMMGVSIVFAHAKTKAEKSLHGRAILRSGRRAMLLILIGWGIQLLDGVTLSGLRFPGVLPRLGVVYFLASVLYIKVSELWLKRTFALILFLYYIGVWLIPSFGGPVTVEHNVVARFDHAVLSPAHLAKFSYTDPCGIISTFPVVATALLGIYAGLVIRRKNLPDDRKVIALLLSGIALLFGGWIFSLFFPLNKPLWSSSYVCYTGGICILGLTSLYWLIDVVKVIKRYSFLTAMGVNAIAAYVLSETLPGLLSLCRFPSSTTTTMGVHIVYAALRSWHFQGKPASVLSGIVFMLFVWLIMYVLYKRKIIIKL